MKPAAFDYVRAASVAEAASLLADGAPDARLLAGGQDMLSRRPTFTQALAPENTDILRVQKSWLFKIRQAVWPQIERVV